MARPRKNALLQQRENEKTGIFPASDEKSPKSAEIPMNPGSGGGLDLDLDAMGERAARLDVIRSRALADAVAKLSR